MHWPCVLSVKFCSRYFIHQRGSRIALASLCLFGVAFITPIISGVVTDRLGWQWTFWLVAIFAGPCVFLVIFCVPEHAFNRAAAIREELGENSINGDNGTTAHHLKFNADQHPELRPRTLTEWKANMVTRGWGPFWKQLAVFTGRKSYDNPFKILLRPIVLLFHPAVFWVCWIYFFKLLTPIGLHYPRHINCQTVHLFALQ